MSAKLTDTYVHVPGPGRLRKAWCELTGGHDNEMLEATTIEGPFAIRLLCKRCRRQTRFYALSKPSYRRALKASGDE